MNKIKWVRELSPAKILMLGFLSVILLGGLLLLLPISARPGVKVHPIDAFFTATSAVCVTGLATIDTADNFNVFGRTVIALLIQVGGLGFMSVAATLMMVLGKKIGLKERIVLKEALNLESIQGVVKLVKSIIGMTLLFEGVGAILSFIVFSQDYPALDAIGISLFHAISAFNNAGFDILGGFQNLIPYQQNILLNLTTSALIILGGLGFYVIRDISYKKCFAKLTMHSKIVIIMTSSLLLIGTVLIWLTEDITWLGAFFNSVSARTAGFTTYNLGEFTNAGLFVLIVLMFIGASPGSTGGGIKTTTMFTILTSIYSLIKNRECVAFKRKIALESIMKAFMLTFLALGVVTIATFFICIIEPDFSFVQIIFEVVSGFATVGLSTGITPHLQVLSKIVLIIMMFFGRLGPLTIACAWSYNHSSNLSYVEEKIIIG